MSNSSKKSGGLTLWALVAIAVGQVVGAGIVTVTGSAIAATGRSAWLSYGVAVFAGLFRIFPIIFFCSTLVVPGGNYGMVTRTLGPKTGGLMTISSLVAWAVRGTAVLSIGIYINSVFPAVSREVGGTVIWTLLIIAREQSAPSIFQTARCLPAAAPGLLPRSFSFLAPAMVNL